MTSDKPSVVVALQVSGRSTEPTSDIRSSLLLRHPAKTSTWLSTDFPPHETSRHEAAKRQHGALELRAAACAAGVLLSDPCSNDKVQHIKQQVIYSLTHLRSCLIGRGTSRLLEPSKTYSRNTRTTLTSHVHLAPCWRVALGLDDGRNNFFLYVGTLTSSMCTLCRIPTMILGGSRPLSSTTGVHANTYRQDTAICSFYRWFVDPRFMSVPRGTAGTLWKQQQCCTGQLPPSQPLA